MASKTAELRELTDAQLLERAESAKEELFNLRFQLATGQLDDSSSIKKVRHEIARIATVMRQRDFETAREAPPNAGSGAPRTGAPRTGTPRTGAPRTGTPRTGTPKTGAPGAESGTESEQ
jgi:large subunit ribosomal protein L29